MNLSQSEWIAVAVVAGFLVFLAIKGKLGNYWTLLSGGGTPAKAAAPPGTLGAAAGGAAAGAAATGPVGQALGSVLGGLGSLPSVPGLPPLESFIF